MHEHKWLAVDHGPSPFDGPLLQPELLRSYSIANTVLHTLYQDAFLNGADIERDYKLVLPTEYITEKSGFMDNPNIPGYSVIKSDHSLLMMFAEGSCLIAKRNGDTAESVTILPASVNLAMSTKMNSIEGACGIPYPIALHPRGFGEPGLMIKQFANTSAIANYVPVVEGPESNWKGPPEVPSLILGRLRLESDNLAAKIDEVSFDPSSIMPDIFFSPTRLSSKEQNQNMTWLQATANLLQHSLNSSARKEYEVKIYQKRCCFNNEVFIYHTILIDQAGTRHGRIELPSVEKILDTSLRLGKSGMDPSNLYAIERVAFEIPQWQWPLDKIVRVDADYSAVSGHEMIEIYSEFSELKDAIYLAMAA